MTVCLVDENDKNEKEKIQIYFLYKRAYYSLCYYMRPYGNFERKPRYILRRLYYKDLFFLYIPFAGRFEKLMRVMDFEYYVHIYMTYNMYQFIFYTNKYIGIRRHNILQERCRRIPRSDFDDQKKKRDYIIMT